MKRVYAAYLGLGLLLAPVPLLNVLQAESAAVVAFVAFFVAGGAALREFGTRETPFLPVLVRQEGALLIPLGILLLAPLWAPNCTVLQGLLFYLLFPGVTVVFAVALAYALQGFELSRPGWVLGGLGVAIAVAGPLYDLGFHPQFYTYNHVFGGVLGPIYDEQLSVRPGLFAFRGLTLLWAGAAIMLGRRLRGQGRQWVLPVLALAIGVVYLFSARLGINTPAWYLQEQLGGHVQTEHFDLYYDSTDVGEARLDALGDTHELHYDWVARRLGGPLVPDGRRIQSYLYPNADVKGRLTGARSTSVSPVWLAEPQVHLLRDRVAASLGHELAHVASRPYGLAGLHASWAPGLVEGWAVALEAPGSGPSPDDLVLTAASADSMAGLYAEAEAVAGRLSPWGFWTGRGGVSYATMGSFVTYLLDRFGPKKLKAVYAWGNFEKVYGESLSLLAEQWARHLYRTSRVDRAAHSVVNRRFTRPSLFETRCPHYVPPARRHLQAAEQAARRRDTTGMRASLQRAIGVAPRFAAAHEPLARLRLAEGNGATVVQQLDTLSSAVRTVTLDVALADAQSLTEQVDSARAGYARAVDALPMYAANTRARIMLRDAVADRPQIIEVLVSGDSARVQAERLANVTADGSAVRAWRAVRLMDAAHFDAALPVWRTVDSPIRSDRPEGWRREWAVQKMGWMARSALQSNSDQAARDLALDAKRRARAVGDESRASQFAWWAQVADGRGLGRFARHGRGISSNRSGGQLGTTMHALLVERQRQSRRVFRSSQSLPRPASSGECIP